MILETSQDLILSEIKRIFILTIKLFQYMHKRQIFPTNQIGVSSSEPSSQGVTSYSRFYPSALRSTGMSSLKFKSLKGLFLAIWVKLANPNCCT